MPKKRKNILLVSGHPAQVHNFKNVKIVLEKNGYKVFWLATEKDISKYLLNHYEIKYKLLNRPGKSILSKAWTLIKNNWLSWRYIRKKKIDLVVSRVSPYVSLAALLAGKPHIGMSDTETSGMYDTIFGLTLSALLTSTSFKRILKNDQIRFKGNIELFYLHPNRFQAKDDVHDLLKISESEPYIILRFVSWDAYHDKGLSGFTDENKRKAVEEFSKYGRVFITSEIELPEGLEPYRINIPPERMHDVLAHTKLFFGESATMASESAVLGRPAIFLDKHGRGYTDEEVEYGLVYNFKNSEEDQLAAIQKGVELLQNENLEENLHQNHNRFISEKIDPTAFLVWFIENWPESKQIMIENPDYQDRFK